MDYEVHKHIFPQPNQKPLKFYASKVETALAEGAGFGVSNNTVEVPGNMIIRFSYDADYLRDVCHLNFYFGGLGVEYRLMLDGGYNYPGSMYNILPEIFKQFIKKFRAENLGYDSLVYLTFEKSLIGAANNILTKASYSDMGYNSGGFIESNPSNKIKFPILGNAVVSKNPVAETSKKLPGVDTNVTSPCECSGRANYQMSVWSTIQHLNDHHRWTREKIADWIDELHDSGVINAEFESWDDKPLDTDQPVE